MDFGAPALSQCFPGKCQVRAVSWEALCFHEGGSRGGKAEGESKRGKPNGRPGDQPDNTSSCDKEDVLTRIENYLSPIPISEYHIASH